MPSPLIITAALTGAEVSKEQQPNLPISPQEIGIAAAECVAAGATVVHVHARNPDGSPSQAVEIYQQIIEEINSRCEVIIQLSTGGAVGMSSDERIAPVYLRPEMATLSLGTLNFADEIFVNSPSDISKFATIMQELAIKIELEIFDSGMLATAKRLLKNGTLVGVQHFDFVLGVPGGMSATIESLVYLLNSMPNDATWTVAALGAAQLPMSAHAIALGGHVRVGFEDNIYFRKGQLATSNAQLVARVAKLGELLERPPATLKEAREILQLSNLPAE